MVKSEKCGSKVFLVDETATHLEIYDEIILVEASIYLTAAEAGTQFTICY